MATVIVSTVLQVAVALLIAVGIWAAFGRGRQPFLEFVGLTGAPFRLLLLGIGIGVIAAGLLLHVPGISQMAGGEGSVAASLRAPGAVATMTSIVLIALLKTSFTEELIFRGLLAKWLVLRLGFGLGNTVQAVSSGPFTCFFCLCRKRRRERW
jgi:membrane protease YdiL (CAAX protease family)